ncbi:hypothetical protein [Bosea sp. BIWAKO-01]|uniref:hypothetical protein n=1 Tax=Bosea sp. BIWAKO-01 TaxID=506668 RepID=UPI0008532352|nr:hypothetical protein [Bosea sp. BIWAKO-01]
MRALMVAGMLLVASQAAADGFGVTVKKFVTTVVARPEFGLKDRGCEPEYCSVSDESEKRRLYIRRDRKNVVTQVLFELPLPASAWSDSASILDLVQFGLSVPPLGRIAGAEITRMAKTLAGAGVSIRGPEIICSAMVAKNKPDTILGACNPD